MIDGKASYAVRSQLCNLDSSPLINKVCTIDTALMPHIRKAARKANLDWRLFHSPRGSRGEPEGHLSYNGPADMKVKATGTVSNMSRYAISNMSDTSFPYKRTYMRFVGVNSLPDRKKPVAQRDLRH